MPSSRYSTRLCATFTSYANPFPAACNIRAVYICALYDVTAVPDAAGDNRFEFVMRSRVNRADHFRNAPGKQATRTTWRNLNRPIAVEVMMARRLSNARFYRKSPSILSESTRSVARKRTNSRSFAECVLTHPCTHIASSRKVVGFSR